MDMDRYWRLSKRRDEQIRQRMVSVCKDIERMLIRFWRSQNNVELLGEVLDARADRERIWGK
jgi:hypothetical protein